MKEGANGENIYVLSGSECDSRDIWADADILSCPNYLNNGKLYGSSLFFRW